MRQSHTLSPRSVKRFPDPVSARSVVIETTALSVGMEDGKTIGNLIFLADVADIGEVIVKRQKLIPGDRPLIQLPTDGPFSLRGELFDWVEGVVKVTVWEADLSTPTPSPSPAPTPTPAPTPISSGSAIAFDPLPSTSGISLGAGRAIFTGAEADFWKIGARSQQRYESGLISFGAGAGRAVLGLVPAWPTVDFLAVRYAWYIHSFTEARTWDWATGQVASAETFAWSPADDLALRIVGGEVRYLMAGEEVYTSPVTFAGPHHFVCVLGPNAFVFNCNYFEG